MSGDPQGRPAPASGPLIFRHTLPDGFGRYHDLIGVTGASSSRVGEAFEATVAGHNAPGLMLFDRQVVGVEHRREPAHIRADGFEHFYLQVLRSGMLMAGAPGEERWLAPGDAVLMDAKRPQRTVVVAADYVTLVLARPLVEAAVPDARLLHGRRIPGAASPGLGDAVLSLVRRAKARDAAALAGAGEMVADLLAAVVEAADVRDDAGLRAADRLRVALFIDAHIGRAGLDVGAVAVGVGMSRSALYRAFEAMGGVEREIGRRRIARFRSALLRVGEGRSMEQLAAEVGFGSLSHCSRLFKEAYGETPGECRAEVRRGQTAFGGGLRADHMREWYEDLGAGA